MRPAAVALCEEPPHFLRGGAVRFELLIFHELTQFSLLRESLEEGDVIVRFTAPSLISIFAVNNRLTSEGIEVDGLEDMGSGIATDSGDIRTTAKKSRRTDSQNIHVLRDWVGAGDLEDYFFFTSPGAASYIMGLEAAYLGTSVWMSVGTLSENGEFQVLQQTVITPNAAIHALDGMRLETGEQYYIRIHAEEDSIGANYELYIKADVEDASLITDNNTMETATELSRTEDTAARIQSWVGAGDALDYYRLELDRSGNLTIRLDELETNVRVKVYQERSNGSTSLKYITTARASEGLDQTLALTSGTYFIEIASNDNGAGRYNSTYALELEKEEEGENHRFTIANA